MNQMKPKMLLGSALAFIALMAFVPWSASAEDAFPWLRLGAGAQSIGVGGAVTATVDDATATVWNPAGLASVKNTTFTVSTFNKGFDARQSFLGIAHNLGGGSIGLAVSGVTVDDLEHRDANDIRRGTFRANSNAVSLSYGHMFGNIGIGIGVGVLTDVYSLDAERVNGVRGADIGIIGRRTHTTPSGKEIPVFTYGLAVRNLGSSYSGNHSESAVPMLVDAGVAFKLPRKGAGVTFSFDVEHEFAELVESTTSARIGAEYMISKRFAIRGGARGSQDHQSLFGGFGVNVGALQIDYALQDAPASRLMESGTTHHVSMSYSY
ncbi:MAG: PorV/PorQ family protein [Candidatus Poribacteria bacterium]|nr:PorV/PorQ family protein [Candidatus Poribacteria bacterium]MDE0504892.1 PorV/PorQ family protein [Candidatus Poribacteria bacterium]